MNLESLMAKARSRVSIYAPRDVDINMAVIEAGEDIADMVIEKLQSAMEQAVIGAQSILRSTAQEYIEALYFKDDLTIGIREEAEHLEYGYDQREMLESILDGKSGKTAKDGSRYAVVPIGSKKQANVVEAITKKTSELLGKGREVKASQRTLEGMVSDMQALIRRSSRAPVAARGSSENEFRTASDKQDGSSKWVHPGFQGVNQLEFINSQLRTDLEEGAVRALESAISRMRR